MIELGSFLLSANVVPLSLLNLTFNTIPRLISSKDGPAHIYDYYTGEPKQYSYKLITIQESPKDADTG